MMPEVSAGSNQVGANEMCAAQVSCPCAAAAAVAAGPARRPKALSASRSRRVKPPAPRPGAIVELMLPSPPLRALDRDVFERRGIREARDLAERGFADPRPDPVQEGEFP